MLTMFYVLGIFQRMVFPQGAYILTEEDIKTKIVKANYIKYCNICDMILMKIYSIKNTNFKLAKKFTGTDIHIIYYNTLCLCQTHANVYTYETLHYIYSLQHNLQLIDILCADTNNHKNSL